MTDDLSDLSQPEEPQNPTAPQPPQMPGQVPPAAPTPPPAAATPFQPPGAPTPPGASVPLPHQPPAAAAPPPYQPPAQQYPPPAVGGPPPAMAGGPQYGAPMAPPPAKKRGKGLWIVLGILGFFVVGIGGCVFFVFGAVTGAADAGNEFIALLDEGNIPAAYEAFDESCRDFSQEELAGVLGGADITDYNLNNSSINSSNGVTRGTVSGTIELDGSPVPVTIELVKNGDWEVCGFFLGN